MKVKCIKNQGYENSITIGKVYKVIEYRNDDNPRFYNKYYRIIDDNEKEPYYDAKWFFLIPPLKKLEIIRVKSDFEFFVNRDDIEILTLDIKGMEPNGMFQDGFIAIIYYQELEQV